MRVAGVARESLSIGGSSASAGLVPNVTRLSYKSFSSLGEFGIPPPLGKETVQLLSRARQVSLARLRRATRIEEPSPRPSPMSTWEREEDL